MARVTVEDCLDHVDNRFDLVLLATRRARQLSKGVEPLLPWQNDKTTVMALREIAEGILDYQAIKDAERQQAQEKEREDANKALEQALAEKFLPEL